MNSNILSGIDFVQGPRNEIFICCPYCQNRGRGVDTKYHLGINTIKGVYHCFRCDASGRISDIKEFSLLAPTTPSEDFSALKNKLRKLFVSSYRDFDLDHISWPLDQKDTPLAFNYIINRGFSPQEVIKYKLRVGKIYQNSEGVEIKRIAGRIIFPFFSDERCVYYIARTMTGAEPKYLNSDGSKSTLVYNIDNVKNQCILCEGIISAISAERTTGIPSVAVLGKSVSNFQINRIRSKCNKIYLSLDGDCSEEENNKVLKRLIRLFDEVYLIKLPYGTDPDELKSDYLKYFNEAKRISLLDSF